MNKYTTIYTFSFICFISFRHDEKDWTHCLWQRKVFFFCFWIFDVVRNHDTKKNLNEKKNCDKKSERFFDFIWIWFRFRNRINQAQNKIIENRKKEVKNQTKKSAMWNRFKANFSARKFQCFSIVSYRLLLFHQSQLNKNWPLFEKWRRPRVYDIWMNLN